MLCVYVCVCVEGWGIGVEAEADLAHHLNIDLLVLEDAEHALQDLGGALHIADYAYDGHAALVRHLAPPP